jgi:hypothetical protein
MSLEQQLTDLTTAIMHNTVALKALASGPAETKARTARVAAAAPAAEAVPTVDDLRKAAQAFVDLCLEKGQDANDNDAQTLIKAINVRQGTKALSKDTPEAARAGVIAEIKAATEVTRAKTAAAASSI